MSTKTSGYLFARLPLPRSLLVGTCLDGFVFLSLLRLDVNKTEAFCGGRKEQRFSVEEK